MTSLIGIKGLQIAAGGHHTLLLAEAGSSTATDDSHMSDVDTSGRVLYSWGRGGMGATGLGATDNTCRPNSIKALEGLHVVQVLLCGQGCMCCVCQGAVGVHVVVSTMMNTP